MQEPLPGNWQRLFQFVVSLFHSFLRDDSVTIPAKSPLGVQSDTFLTR